MANPAAHRLMARDLVSIAPDRSPETVTDFDWACSDPFSADMFSDIYAPFPLIVVVCLTPLIAARFKCRRVLCALCTGTVFRLSVRTILESMGDAKQKIMRTNRVNRGLMPIWRAKKCRFDKFFVENFNGNIR